MGLIETALKKVLITQHPEDRKVLCEYESLDDLLRYIKDNLSTSEAENVQHMVADYLHSGPDFKDVPIETGSFDPDLPLPLISELEDP